MLATMVATAQQKSEMKRTTDYFQDEKIVLWNNDKAPHSNGLTGEAYEAATHRLVNTTEAVLYAYKADEAKATGQAVVICPGGGYAKLSMDQEGYLMAQWLAKNGIAAFVLEYRLPNGQLQPTHISADTAYHHRTQVHTLYFDYERALRSHRYTLKLR